MSKLTVITKPHADKTTVQLIGIGHVVGVAAEDLEPGMTLVWNYGETSKYVKLIGKTAKFVKFEEESKSGLKHVRRFKKTRIVGVHSDHVRK